MKSHKRISLLLAAVLMAALAMAQEPQPIKAFGRYEKAADFNDPDATFGPRLSLHVRIPLLPPGTSQTGRVEVLADDGQGTTQQTIFQLADCNVVCSCCSQNAEWWWFGIPYPASFQIQTVTVTYYQGAESAAVTLVGLP